MKSFTKWFALFIILILAGKPGVCQQLKLGKNPYTVQKSAVLELNSDNQGLLMVRISDTNSINSLMPPDGMVIFFTPTSQLFVRSGGHWNALVIANNLSNYWSVNANETQGLKKIGTVDNFGLSFLTNNIERLRISATGDIGIGSSVTPTTTVQIKSGIANDAGLRLENLTTASPVTLGASAIGVDATGKIVKTKTPIYYSGGAGGTATAEQVTKIWVAEVANSATGLTTITFPTNISFTAILNIQVTAKSANGLTTAPFALISSNTLTSAIVRLLESKNTPVVALGTVEGLEAHTDVNTKIYIRVEGY